MGVGSALRVSPLPPPGHSLSVEALPFCCKLLRRPVAQRRVWTFLVVVPPPLFDDLARIADREEPVLVPALAVEALDIAVLHRFSRLDEVLLHSLCEAPLVQRPPGELRAVVGADLPRPSTLANQPL